MNFAIVAIIFLLSLFLFFVVLIAIGLRGDKKKEPKTTEPTTETETVPVNSKRNLLLPMFRRDSLAEFWGLLILIAAFSAGFIYLRYFR